jgi:hypothetical protein
MGTNQPLTVKIQYPYTWVGMSGGGGIVGKFSMGTTTFTATQSAIIQ